jgi:flagellin-specific chaperone FliS
MKLQYKQQRIIFEKIQINKRGKKIKKSINIIHYLTILELEEALDHLLSKLTTFSSISGRFLKTFISSSVMESF